MSRLVELELPDLLAQRVGAVARRTHRRVEDVLLEWIGRASEDVAPEELSDEQVVALCDLEMSAGEQHALSELLARQREGVLALDERSRLDELLATYRSGLVRKGRAFQVAVSRGLRTLSD